ncbi:MAG: hypothetical protein HC786_06800 [Richelia sp. CSU_2_1]|nr:hypothetical protein [Microcoleus sp. SM1_3_4]NJR21888.1 hypothetical protein [Richelia sp. CSU_2_1]
MLSNCFRSIINYQTFDKRTGKLSTVNCQLSTLNSQLIWIAFAAAGISPIAR